MKKKAESIAGDMLRLLDEALRDPRQLYRYHVTEKTERGNEVVERTFEKFDTKTAREMASLLRELSAIQEGREAGGSASGVIVLPEAAGTDEKS